MGENNICLTGDQARMLIAVLTSPNVQFKGDALPNMYIIFGQLLAISNAQPPQS